MANLQSREPGSPVRSRPEGCPDPVSGHFAVSLRNRRKSRLFGRRLAVAFAGRIWHRSARWRPEAAATLGCGCSSGVEHDLAKVGVEGSNPFARSRISWPSNDLTTSRREAALSFYAPCRPDAPMHGRSFCCPMAWAIPLRKVAAPAAEADVPAHADRARKPRRSRIFSKRRILCVHLSVLCGRTAAPKQGTIPRAISVLRSKRR